MICQLQTIILIKFTKRLFKMVKVRGKGLGYVALQDIEPGTLLLSDPPMLVSNPTDLSLSLSSCLSSTLLTSFGQGASFNV